MRRLCYWLRAAARVVATGGGAPNPNTCVLVVAGGLRRSLRNRTVFPPRRPEGFRLDGMLSVCSASAVACSECLAWVVGIARARQPQVHAPQHSQSMGCGVASLHHSLPRKGLRDDGTAWAYGTAGVEQLGWNSWGMIHLFEIFLVFLFRFPSSLFFSKRFK